MPRPCALVFAALAVTMLLAGCVSDYTPPPRRMPTVGATPPAATPVVSEAAALDEAALGANAEAWATVSRALATQPSTVRPRLARALVGGLVPADFAKAQRLVLALPAGLTRSAALDQLARAYVENDPAAALAWALAVAEPTIHSTALQSTAEHLIAREAATTVARLLALPATPARTEIAGYAAAAWARREPRPALAWLQSLPPGDLKDRATTSMGFALAQIDPPVALELLDSIPTGRNRQVLVGAIGQTWVARNADAAWRWARQLPAAADREAALAGIETGLGGAGTRASRDTRNPTGRIRSGGGGKAGEDGPNTPTALDRDDALRREFAALLQESPARAANWLSTLPTSDRRDDMVDDLVRRWLPENPAAARNWIDQNIFSPTRRESLIREAEARGDE